MEEAEVALLDPVLLLLEDKEEVVLVDKGIMEQ
jgi:hypothetical protein